MKPEDIGPLRVLFIGCQEGTERSLNQGLSSAYYDWLQVMNEIQRRQELAERAGAKIWAELTPEELREKAEALGLSLSPAQLEEAREGFRRLLQRPLAYGSVPIPLAEEEEG